MKMIRFISGKLLLCVVVASVVMSAQAADKLKYGDFNSWVIRNIKESSVLGGNTKTLYEIGPNQTI